MTGWPVAPGTAYARAMPDDLRATPPLTLTPAPDAPPYRPDPTSRFRVKFDARVDFTNGGHVEAQDFLDTMPFEND